MAKQQTKTANSVKKTAKAAPKSAPKPKTQAGSKQGAGAGGAGAKLNTWEDIIKEITSIVNHNMDYFIKAEDIENSLNSRDRRRLFSAGSHNYGFIDKAFDIAHDNPSFMPPNFNAGALYSNLRGIEYLRQLVYVLQQFLQLATNSYLLQSDICYRDALRIYRSLQEQAKSKVPGADKLVESLKTFFHRRKGERDEPTEIQLERHIKQLQHGKADGEVIIRNESPHLTGGIHTVVDNVHKGRATFKGTAEAEENEG
jgi:hypothetical protein